MTKLEARAPRRMGWDARRRRIAATVPGTEMSVSGGRIGVLEQGLAVAGRWRRRREPCQPVPSKCGSSADSFAFVGALDLIDWIWIDGTTGVQLPFLW
jgi:hypothetical protein